MLLNNSLSVCNVCRCFRKFLNRFIVAAVSTFIPASDIYKLTRTAIVETQTGSPYIYRRNHTSAFHAAEAGCIRFSVQGAQFQTFDPMNKVTASATPWWFAKSSSCFLAGPSPTIVSVTLLSLFEGTALIKLRERTNRYIESFFNHTNLPEPYTQSILLRFNFRYNSFWSYRNPVVQHQTTNDFAENSCR